MDGNYKIIDLIASEAFQGLYAGTPTPEMYENEKKKVLNRIDYIHGEVNDLVKWEFKKIPGVPYRTYGHIGFVSIDFGFDVFDGPADWYSSNILFNYYPQLGEKIEDKIKEIVRGNKLIVNECYF